MNDFDKRWADLEALHMAKVDIINTDYCFTVWLLNALRLMDSKQQSDLLDYLEEEMG